MFFCVQLWLVLYFIGENVPAESSRPPGPLRGYCARAVVVCVCEAARGNKASGPEDNMTSSRRDKRALVCLSVWTQSGACAPCWRPRRFELFSIIFCRGFSPRKNVRPSSCRRVADDSDRREKYRPNSCSRRRRSYRFGEIEGGVIFSTSLYFFLLSFSVHVLYETNYYRRVRDERTLNLLRALSSILSLRVGTARNNVLPQQWRARVCLITGVDASKRVLSSRTSFDLTHVVVETVSRNCSPFPIVM